MNFRYKLIALLLFIFLEKIVNGQILEINDSKDIINVKNQTTYLEDTANNFTIEKVVASKNFKKIESDIPNFEISSSSFWLKLDIKNRSLSENFLLEISNPGLDEIVLYQKNVNGTMNISYSGEKYIFKSRMIWDPNYIFRIKLVPNSITQFFIKVKARDYIQVPIIIGNTESLLERNKRKDTMIGLFLGVMLVMLLYNSFIYFTVRDKTYIAYVLYILAVLLTQASILGYTFQYLWPQWPLLAQYSSFIFPPLVGVASIFFIRVFLRTSYFVPAYHKGFNFFIIGYAIAIFFTIFGFYKISFTLINFCAGCLSFYMLWVAYLIQKKGYRPATFFLIAWTIFLTGVSVFVMKNFGILPFNNITNYMMPAGSAIEVVLLSFALADSINILKREKELSQAEALKALKANEKLIKEQNIILEQKVHDRTEELEVKNIQLGDALNHLKETQSQLVGVEKMASLGQLTAGIAHEINNPINFVSSNIKPLQLDIADIFEILNKYDSITSKDDFEDKLEDINTFKDQIDLNYVKDEINSLLAGIEDGASRTAEIVKGLKNFSHLDSSDINRSNINTGIESTLVLIRSTLPPNIKIVKNLGVIPEIECYPGKLNQVFMNMFVNGIQAMIKCTTRKNHFLTISTFPVNNHVHVTIEDTGIGMTLEVKEKIFEPFFTTKDIGEGTGLGMSIVFGIIENHKGKIEIETEPDKGTKMTIILPLVLNIR